MSGSIGTLALTMGLFVASHLLLAWPPIRSALAGRIGERAFRGVYSVLAIALISWSASAYSAAPAITVWSPPIGLMHLALPIVLIATLLLVAGVSTPNPAAIGGERPEGLAHGPTGVLKVTRHPVMWGIGLWGIAHLLANGDLASLLLFGGLTVLALLGALAQDAKKRVQHGAAWDAFTARTSYLPFAALAAGRTRLTLAEIGWWRLALGVAVFAALFALHPWLFGVSPLPY